MSTASLRTLRGLSLLRAPAARTLTTSARRAEAAKPSPTAGTPPDLEAEPTALGQQAPNRVDVWARGQKHRTAAMTGPRFEQTEATLQVGLSLGGSGVGWERRRDGIRVIEREERVAEGRE